MQKIKIQSRILQDGITIILKVSDMVLTGVYPSLDSLQEGKFVDELGQNKQKCWKSKVKNVDELKEILQRQEAENHGEYPSSDWSGYGGWKQKKLGEATGFFTKYKAGERWFLADPMR